LLSTVGELPTVTSVASASSSHGFPTMLPLLLALVVSAAFIGLVYLVCYGGFEGPVDWAMHTEAHGSRDRRTVALTFDDGPDPVRTPALLDALAELDVKATFFVLGSAVEANPALTARIVREGHELGNHTFTHRYLPLASSAAVADELLATDRAIARATGIVPSLARPPYGGRSPWTVRAFARLAKRVVLWDVNSWDWKGLAATDIARGVVDRTRPGSLVLLHEARTGGETTIDAVRLLVPELRARGFAFDTASRTLA
jgi:peptidoglycan/xylan/chitin deacetylase (PgdA/CDA1 family)